MPDQPLPYPPGLSPVASPGFAAIVTSPLSVDLPTSPPAAGDGYLLINLSESVLTGYALAEPDPQVLTAFASPAGLSLVHPASGFAAQGAVSGSAPSRLAEVRGFDSSAPYAAGQYGVTHVDGVAVEYTLDQINYRTIVATGETTYRIGYVDPVAGGLLSPRALMGRDELMYHERRPLLNNIFLDRNDGPVLLDFYSVARANTLEELPH
jgi:hypothetical protein